ncbi:MAG: septum site-determining protein MinC, partial [Brachymonas denitrificans]
MTVETPAQSRTSFEFKSAFLSVVALALKTADTGALASDLATQLANDPDFFDNDALLIDLAAVRESDADIDFPAIVALLRQYRTLPVAVRGGSESQMAAALAAGLA